MTLSAKERLRQFRSYYQISNGVKTGHCQLCGIETPIKDLKTIIHPTLREEVRVCPKHE